MQIVKFDVFKTIMYFRPPDLTLKNSLSYINNFYVSSLD